MSRQQKISSLVLLTLASLCLFLNAAPTENKKATNPRSFTRPHFDKLGCGGVYDNSTFARLDRMCEDCYNLYREPSFMTNCSRNCFSTRMFPECLVVLNYYDEQEEFFKKVEYLNGKGFERMTTTAEPTTTTDRI